MKRMLVRGVFGTALAAVIGILSPGMSAASASPLWSVVVHIEYEDGFVYENAFATGVPTSMLPSILEECGSAHRWNRSVVQYHCYPTAER